MKLVLSYLLVMFFIASCTMQKRVHRPGWHVQWNSKTRTSKTVTEKLPKEIASNTDDVEKSTEEPSEIAFDRKNEAVSSVQIIEDQSEIESTEVKQVNYGNDGLPSKENPYEVSQEERELNISKSVEPQNAEPKSKDRRALGIVFMVLAAICLLLAILFLTTSLGLNEFFIVIIVAIFGFLFLLVGTTLISRSKK